MRKEWRIVITRLVWAIVIAVVLASSCSAALTVTAQGASLGFSLTRFVTTVGQPGGGFAVGPLGMALLSNGNVLVDVNNQAKNYIWPNADNQNLGTALSSTAGPSCCPAYAVTNGAAYGSNGSVLVKFNNDGTIAQTYNSVPAHNGLWTNPVNGHLIGVGNGLIDIDVSGATPSVRTITNSAGSDGVSVSPDGTIVYTSEVAGYKISDGTRVLGPINVPGGPDGTGVISSSSAINGDVLVNTNSGTLVLIDVHNGNNQITIASNGTRGDYTAPDPSTGTLFITQSDEIYRLSCGAGCAVGSAPSTVPIPSSFLLLLTGVALVGIWFSINRLRHA